MGPVFHSFEPPPLYRPRNARASPLYQLFETYYEDVKAVWEDRFQKKFGFWRGFVDTVVARFLDCGVAEGRFARLRCDTPSGPPPLPPCSRMSFWKTSAIACGLSPFQRKFQ